MPASKKLSIRVPKARKPRAKRAQTPSHGLGVFPGRAVRTALPTYTYDFHLAPQTVLMVGNPSPTASINGPSVPIQSTGGVTVLTSSPASGISNMLDVSLACSHALSDCTNATSFDTLYDQYRFEEISCKLTWLGGTRSGNGASVNPTFYFYPDFDDAVPPNGLETILAKQGVVSWDPGSDETRSVTYKFKPRMKGLLMSLPGLNPSNVVKPNWLDCLSPNIQHFASKIYLRDMSVPDATYNPALENAVRIEFAYRISFRNPIKAS